MPIDETFRLLTETKEKKTFWEIYSQCFDKQAADFWRKATNVFDQVAWKAWRPLFLQRLKYRIIRWKTSEILQNELIRDGEDVDGGRTYIYYCSQPECKRKSGAASGLRMTPSGIFCEFHYLTLPTCKDPRCHEPAVIDPEWNPYDMCSIHDPKFLNEF